MTLQTERLLLRPWRETDAARLYEYAKDPRIGPPAGWPPHTSIENSREIIRTVLSVPETYAVCLKEDNKAIGSIGLLIGKKSNLSLPDREGEIGYWLGVPFWGQGLIPEAMRELIRHAFADLHLERLWCGYFDGNEKSRRAQEKCGFVYQRTEPDIRWALTNDIRTEHITCLEREYARPLLPDEIPKAAALAWEVFLQYEAPVYSEAGIQTFRRFLDGRQPEKPVRWYGAFADGSMVGVLAMRERQHICLFFVKAARQRKGYGRLLFERMKADYAVRRFTVNSSPYAVPIYEKLGFIASDAEQTADGIRFTPMIYPAADVCGTGRCVSPNQTE